MSRPLREIRKNTAPTIATMIITTSVIQSRLKYARGLDKPLGAAGRRRDPYQRPRPGDRVRIAAHTPGAA